MPKATRTSDKSDFSTVWKLLKKENVTYLLDYLCCVLLRGGKGKGRGGVGSNIGCCRGLHGADGEALRGQLGSGNG